MSDKPHLLVYTHGGGRFGNQLLNHAHLTAFVIESKGEHRLVNLAFGRYVTEYFGKQKYINEVSRSLVRKVIIRYYNFLVSSDDYLYKSYVEKVVPRFIFRVLTLHPGVNTLAIGALGKPNAMGKSVNLEQTNIRNTNKKVTLLGGWGFRAWSTLRRHSMEVRKELTPSDEYVQLAADFIAHLRTEFDEVVGVMVRQGDYRVWEGGKYFFDSSFYRDRMCEYRRRSNSNKIAFVIASDEPQNMENYSDLNCFFTTGIAGGGGHYLESFTELSMCDLIITPPSTFSGMAAFLGEVPILPVYDGCSMSKDDIYYNNIFDSINGKCMSDAIY